MGQTSGEISSSKPVRAWIRSMVVLDESGKPQARLSEWVLSFKIESSQVAHQVLRPCTPASIWMMSQTGEELNFSTKVTREWRGTYR